jgi:hypothetical protein
MGFGLWETVGMAKHKFLIGVGDNSGNLVGTRCARCGKIAKFENAGNIPEEIQSEECTPEDASQAAARIVREATKK